MSFIPDSILGPIVADHNLRMARLRANPQFTHLAALMGDDLSDIEPAAEESSTMPRGGDEL